MSIWNWMDTGPATLDIQEQKIQKAHSYIFVCRRSGLFKFTTKKNHNGKRTVILHLTFK